MGTWSNYRLWKPVMGLRRRLHLQIQKREELTSTASSHEFSPKTGYSGRPYPFHLRFCADFPGLSTLRARDQGQRFDGFIGIFPQIAIGTAGKIEDGP